MYDYYDERIANLDRQRAEQREAERNAVQYHPQGGVVGMALLPAAALIGALCGTLRVILEQRREQERIRAEAQCLEDLILNATERAQDGQIIPMERIVRGCERV